MATTKQVHDQKTQTLYREQGMGLHIPPGNRPAVVVIDMQHDFCDPDAPTTLWPSIGETYEPIKRLCTLARQRQVPVIYTQGLVAADGSSAGLWRFKQRFHAEMKVQIEGSRGAQIIAELAPQPGDRVIRKWRPSAFFRTDLEVFLAAGRIDTLLCCGTSASGCVRATVTDAFMRDIPCMVVRECVADRTDAVLQANLFDLQQKYAEVISVADALSYLRDLPKDRASPRSQREAVKA
jgi:nicotinamidase-related amidase